MEQNPSGVRHGGSGCLVSPIIAGFVQDQWPRDREAVDGLTVPAADGRASSAGPIPPAAASAARAVFRERSSASRHEPGGPERASKINSPWNCPRYIADSMTQSASGGPSGSLSVGRSHRAPFQLRGRVLLEVGGGGPARARCSSSMPRPLLAPGPRSGRLPTRGRRLRRPCRRAAELSVSGRRRGTGPSPGNTTRASAASTRPGPKHFGTALELVAYCPGVNRLLR